MSDLVERLLKRAKEDQMCADNSAVVAEALSEQMRLFEKKEGHNIYAVRLAVDHQNSVKRDIKYASDLREAAAEITRLQKELEKAREALEATRRLSVLDNRINEASASVMARMAEIHQHSDAALAALKDKEAAG